MEDDTFGFKQLVHSRVQGSRAWCFPAITFPVPLCVDQFAYTIFSCSSLFHVSYPDTYTSHVSIMFCLLLQPNIILDNHIIKLVRAFNCVSDS